MLCKRQTVWSTFGSSFIISLIYTYLLLLASDKSDKYTKYVNNNLNNITLIQVLLPIIYLIAPLIKSLNKKKNVNKGLIERILDNIKDFNDDLKNILGKCIFNVIIPIYIVLIIMIRLVSLIFFSNKKQTSIYILIGILLISGLFMALALGIEIEDDINTDENSKVGEVLKNKKNNCSYEIIWSILSTLFIMCLLNIFLILKFKEGPITYKMNNYFYIPLIVLSLILTVGFSAMNKKSSFYKNKKKCARGIYILNSSLVFVMSVLGRFAYNGNNKLQIGLLVMSIITLLFLGIISGIKFYKEIDENNGCLCFKAFEKIVDNKEKKKNKK